MAFNATDGRYQTGAAMNPQTIVFLELSKSVVGTMPTETSSTFRFALGESDMVGFCIGVAVAIVVPWLYRKLQRKPVPWASRRTVRIYDIAHDDRKHITHDDSADDLHSVVFGRCRSVPSIRCGE